LAAVPAFADPSVTSKRAQAQQVMAQLAQLSNSLERARSQYDASTQQLAKIQNDLRVNAHELKLAKHNLKASQRVIAQRLVTLYTSDQASTLEVVLGARSLDDMITRMDSAKSITGLDARVLSQVKSFRVAVKRNHELLSKARVSQQRVVSQRASAKASIGAQISQQQSLLSSIKGQIAQIVAAERARQLQMAAAAQARLSQAHRVAQAQAQDTIVGASAVAPQADTVVAPPSGFSGAVGVAMAQLGKPYVWAASGPDSFDCSGLIVYAFATVGKSLPHSTYALYSLGVPVSRDQLQPGDLVFFDGLGHAGIYIGGDQFVHAPHSGDVVKISSLSEDWYASTYVGARRIL
jgi:cell wall-associated NlpC family hydrolase